MKISKMIQENISYINEILPVKESFDIIERDMIIGGRESCFFFIDGFMKDEVMSKVMDTLFKLTPEEMPKTATELSRTMISYVEIDTFSEYDEIIKNILSGVSCLFVDGFESCIAIDCRTYPSRSVDEPAQDKSLRGSRDGFVETIVFNTALMRRRIRDPHLTMKMTEIGKSSRTDVALCYMSDRVDQNLLSLLTQKLEAMQEEDLKMNQQSLAELLFKRKWYNPFPKFKYTERPDTAAACLLEGKIILLVDTSPSAMILPTSIFDMIEEANDYYFPTLTGIYLKISRGLITLMTIFLTPLFLLFMQNPEIIPSWLEFIQLSDTAYVPLIYQLLILEFAIDGLRLAAVNTPSMLTTPLSVIAGIVMGEYSVKSGWFNSETMLYMAFVTIANYSQSSFEMSYAFKFSRILILIFTALFNFWGFFLGSAICICAIVFNRTIAGKSYIYPLIPFHFSELKKRFFRNRLPHKQKS